MDSSSGLTIKVNERASRQCKLPERLQSPTKGRRETPTIASEVTAGRGQATPRILREKWLY